MRSLATIATISALRTHPNADSLELAAVRGWQICVKKGEFKAGDLCVYCEIDSVLPERPEFEFLRERSFRIRTIRLRKELSQGICFPLTILHEKWVIADYQRQFIEGDDVTSALGITLYQPPIPACLGGEIEGSFPSFIPKTDCERLQNCLWLLEKYKNLEWAATEKADGASCSVMWKDGKLHVCSRNWELRDEEKNAYWQAVKSAGLLDKLQDSPIALQGELVGPKIQGNRYQHAKPTLYFFDAYDMNEGRYLDFVDFKKLCDRWDVETVPLVCTRAKLGKRSLAEMLNEAEDKSDLNLNTEREGLIWKPMVETIDPDFGRVAFKVISNKFLLRGE